MRRQQADEVQLDLLPDFIVDGLGVVLVFQRCHAFRDAIVIRRDAVACALRERLPVAFLEQMLRLDCRFAKDAVMAIEAFEYRLRDIEAYLRREQLGEVIHVGWASRWPSCGFGSAGALFDASGKERAALLLVCFEFGECRGEIDELPLKHFAMRRDGIDKSLQLPRAARGRVVQVQQRANLRQRKAEPLAA